MVARMDMPPHARAGRIGRGHRFAADMERPLSSLSNASLPWSLSLEHP